MRLEGRPGPHRAGGKGSLLEKVSSLAGPPGGVKVPLPSSSSPQVLPGALPHNLGLHLGPGEPPSSPACADWGLLRCSGWVTGRWNPESQGTAPRLG